MTDYSPALGPMSLDAVHLTEGLFLDRFTLNRRYVLSLRSDALLQNHYQEAGLTSSLYGSIEDPHGGWEAPTCQLRGHFLGHWLSAAAKIVAGGDPEVKLRADRVVSELRRCQESNGGEWAGSVPEKYLAWISGTLPRQSIWAPHYTLHKTLMGLLDMHTYAGNDEARDVLERFAIWFHRWSAGFTRAQMDDILDVETGGMLEVWAGLYGVTGNPEHLELMKRYDRPRLFDPLLAGQDVLTNMHANTTIPEAHGAARAYEVTGDERWRRIVEAYWRSAVTERGTFCTGSQTSGEIWTPPFEFAARLGDKNQEHCVVYNMIRLADYLLRWTGEATYADYIERSLYNGILAQQNPQTGMISYFLPLEAGARKKWGRPTQDFWCCHGTLVQAHASYAEWAWLTDEEGPILTQYIPARTRWQAPDGAGVTLTLGTAVARGASDKNWSPAGERHRPRSWSFALAVECDRPVAFTLKLRLPPWLDGAARVSINGEACPADDDAGSFLRLRRVWARDTVEISLPKRLSTVALPDEPGTFAFLDGPIVLAGIRGEERLLEGDPAAPESLLTPDNERQWGTWLPAYRTRGQERGLRFVPLHTVVDDPYTVYFPVRRKDV